MSGPQRTTGQLRAAIGTMSTSDDARADLQARLLVFTRLMFGSFAVLIVFIVAVYEIYPQIEPARNTSILCGEAAALCAMAVIWRGLLVRRALSVRVLDAIDLTYAIGIGTAFAASAYFAPELRPAAWTSLIFACFTVFTRALFVPSTGKRTAMVSALAFVPLIAAAWGLRDRSRISRRPRSSSARS